MFGYLTLFTALIISLSAAVYSILGLTAIFAAAFWPIVIMGGSLEVGKIVTTLWLHKYWDRAEIQYKLYLCSAVAILMLLTSMGVFGFLSKAHSDQGLVSGDAGAKISIYDDKIKTAKDNVDANRKALKQMDEAVDQVMGRSTTEQGADKAVAIRRSQQKERARLLADIEAEQKKVSALVEERAPLAAENRKIEAEVGPIKYIAALIYGDNPEANVLEKSVRWVIILIVIVFDPLALTLLLAATKALEWERGINLLNSKKRKEKYEADDGLLTTDQINQINRMVAETKEETEHIEDPEPDEELLVVKKRFAGFPWVFSSFDDKKKTIEIHDSDALDAYNDERLVSIFDKETLADEHDDESEDMRAIIKQWKLDNPNDTLKHQRHLLDLGEIFELPWVTIANARKSNSGFGTEFPATPVRGDTFMRIDRMPPVMYKFNGTTWIEVDKSIADNYTYDTAYINHLIDKIATGEYDLDMLSDSERDQIALQLQQKPE